MDSIVHSAIEDICVQGTNGISLPELWPKLGPVLSAHGLSPCPAVKQAIWDNLIGVPGLQFGGLGDILDVEEFERLKLKIVASENLRNNFLGIYDIKASSTDISAPQRRVLERLAIARTNGIAQSELAKEFGIKGNYLFNALKKLETQGLIVRQSTLIRTKESSSEREPKNKSIVTTNMLHLYRYAKHLGCQQRLEITKEDKPIVDSEEHGGTGHGFGEESAKDSVHVKDFLPALKAICDKLEKVEGKVLVISDIKKDLGYRGTSGHRAWRHICHRLKDAQVVEEFMAKVDKKEVNCLRLLKKFSQAHFEPKSQASGHHNLDTEQPMKSAKRGQITEQLVELSIFRQVYDMIDAEGPTGLTIKEVCERLRLRNKQYYNRLLAMFSRFGLHLEAESCNRGVAYRVWTDGNFNSKACNKIPTETEIFLLEGTKSNPKEVALELPENLVEPPQVIDNSSSKVDVKLTETKGTAAIEPEVFHETLAVPTEVGDSLSKVDSGAINGIGSTEMESEVSNCLTEEDGLSIQVCPTSSQDCDLELNNRVPIEYVDMLSKTVSDNASLEVSPAVALTPRKRRSYLKYPCLTLGAVSSQREKHILKWLQEEKFLVKPELHRRLESLEEKNTMMDRKTLERSLNKLQKEGHCKCINISFPNVTNCGRSKRMDVVLHPSIDVSSELLSQIHGRMRSFEMQVRSQISSKLKKGQHVPVLDNIHRIPTSAKLDGHAERSEAQRTNGFVFQKMVRTKLLHFFLWGYVSSLSDRSDALFSDKHTYESKNPHRTYILFKLDAAIKSMPVELFFQIAGSSQTLDDMIEKCRSGLRLCDLPTQEYNSLMDTQATGKLSRLINILQRLKLIRLVSNGNAEDVARGPLTILTHALELKPYIEEPVSTVAPSLGFFSNDLRPQIRHDFVLSNRKALDEYWKTLEYCYAAARPEAAIHAFPGSAVHEVFHSRSWVSVRVMTAEQRAKLLKCVTSYDPNKKLLFGECEKIAKDLNLTMEQVLRVYYDKRRQYLTRQEVSDVNEQEVQSMISKRVSSSRKRKQTCDKDHSKHKKTDVKDGKLSPDRVATLMNSDDQLTGEQQTVSTSAIYDGHLHEYQFGGNIEAMEELGTQEEDDNDRFFIHKCALSRLKPARQRKFSWTDKADRQLIIQYAKYRAARGAKFHRTDWASVPSLPAPPDTCKRRMALLNSYTPFRKAMMKLCNLLSKQYASYLEKFQSKSLNSDHAKLMVRDYGTLEDNDRHPASGSGEGWDNFNENDVKMALDDVLQCKGMAKLEASRGFESEHWNSSDKNNDIEEHYLLNTDGASSAPQILDVDDCQGRSKASGQRSTSRCLPRQYVKLLRGGANIGRQAHESVAISNAVELFKLIFLSTSTASEVSALLAETLRRYSEQDLFAAFNYLREKKAMTSGTCNSPFVLSQQFLQNISASPFPLNTGKRAAKFSSWVQEKEEDLLGEGVGLLADLHCGEVLHLCALISSGELSVSPHLPEEGVGEAEDTRNPKRKCSSGELSEDENPKRLRTSLAGEGEITSRREKGFPGFTISLSREKISRIHALELLKEEGVYDDTILHGKDQVHPTSMSDILCISAQSDVSCHVEEVVDSDININLALDARESPWEAMQRYASHLSSSSCSYDETSFSFHSDLFKTVYSAIQKSGDQGLSLEEISRITNVEGEKTLEIIVDVLEAFGRALKVNAYDAVHVVDSLYRSKYFLASVATYQDHAMGRQGDQKRKTGDVNLLTNAENHKDEGVGSNQDINMGVDEVHRVTILNLQDVADLSSEIQSSNKVIGYGPSKVDSCGINERGEKSKIHAVDSQISRPIFPWVNGDGTINELVYKGLVRRIVGIIMQNPGILEDNIIRQMHVLNPQSCRKLLDLMLMDNHITKRKMRQMESTEPPCILGSLFASHSRPSKYICREHFFANPMSTALL